MSWHENLLTMSWHSTGLYELSKDLEENIRHLMEKRLEEQSYWQFQKEF